MTVGLKVGSIIDEIGASSFLNGFFSTVTALLEEGIRGGRFPIFSKQMYQGFVMAKDVPGLIAELDSIREELKSFPPSSVVWDLDDKSLAPPWGTNIGSDITSMSNYFVSSTGRDLFDLLFEALDEAARKNLDASIVSY